jgi:hypothetical protein
MAPSLGLLSYLKALIPELFEAAMSNVRLTVGIPKAESSLANIEAKQAARATAFSVSRSNSSIGSIFQEK